MTFEKMTRKPFPELVADQVENAIMHGTYKIGAQLPSEQQLAGEFGVSRNVVREALKFLKARGLIEIRNGSGAYVIQPTSEPMISALSRYIRMMGLHRSVEMLYEVRRLIEGNNVRLAAERATSADLETIGECLARMKANADSLEKWAQADLEFHLAIARSTQNPFLSVLLEPLMDQIRSVIVEGFVVPGAVERGLDAHDRIYAFLVERDADGAYEAIMEHLRDSETSVEFIYTHRNSAESNDA